MSKAINLFDKMYKKPKGADENGLINECFYSDVEFEVVVTKAVDGIQKKFKKPINNIYVFKMNNSNGDPKKYNVFYTNKSGKNGIFKSNIKTIKGIIQDNNLKKLENIPDYVFDVIKRSDNKIFALGNFLLESKVAFGENSSPVVITKYSDFLGSNFTTLCKGGVDFNVEINRLKIFQENIGNVGHFAGKKNSEIIDSLNGGESCFELIDNNYFYLNESKFNLLTKSKKSKEIIFFIDLIKEKNINLFWLTNIDSYYEKNNILNLLLSNTSKSVFTELIVNNYNKVAVDKFMQSASLNGVLKRDYVDKFISPLLLEDLFKKDYVECLDALYSGSGRMRGGLLNSISLSSLKSVEAFNWLQSNNGVNLRDIYMVKDKSIYDEMIKKIKPIEDKYSANDSDIQRVLLLAATANNFGLIGDLVHTFAKIKDFCSSADNMCSFYIEMFSLSKIKSGDFIRVMKKLETDCGFAKPSIELGNYFIKNNNKDFFDVYYYHQNCNEVERSGFFKSAFITRNNDFIRDFKNRGFKIKVGDIPLIISKLKNDTIIGDSLTKDVTQAMEIFRRNVSEDINGSVFDDGSTLLHCLAKNRKYKLLERAICALEIPLDKRDSNGQTFIQSLFENPMIDLNHAEGIFKMIDMLKPNMLSDFGLFEMILSSNNLEMLPLLRKKGHVFDFNEVASNGDNALHIITKNINKYQNTIFLEKDFNVLSEMIEGILDKTPEMVIVENNYNTPFGTVSHVLSSAKNKGASSVQALENIYSIIYKAKLDVSLNKSEDNKKFKI